MDESNWYICSDVPLFVFDGVLACFLCVLLCSAWLGLACLVAWLLASAWFPDSFPCLIDLGVGVGV